jgi:fimbrial chaperone protein
MRGHYPPRILIREMLLMDKLIVLTITKTSQLTALIILFVSFMSHAYQVQPMSAEIQPVGKMSQYSLRVENTDSFPLTLEFIPLKVSQDKYGINTLSPADEDLLVIPMTAVIQPGKTQTIMVRYLGDPMIKQSQSYSIEINQVSVALADQSDSEVSLAFNFKTLLNVVPSNAKANLQPGKFQKDGDDWTLEVINSGNRYAKVTETEWLLSDGINSARLDRKNINQFVDGKLILPNASRIFKVKQIEGVDMNKAKVEINWNER